MGLPQLVNALKEKGYQLKEAIAKLDKDKGKGSVFSIDDNVDLVKAKKLTNGHQYFLVTKKLLYQQKKLSIYLSFPVDRQGRINYHTPLSAAYSRINHQQKSLETFFGTSPSAETANKGHVYISQRLATTELIASPLDQQLARLKRLIQSTENIIIQQHLTENKLKLALAKQREQDIKSRLAEMEDQAFMREITPVHREMVGLHKIIEQAERRLKTSIDLGEKYKLLAVKQSDDSYHYYLMTDILLGQGTYGSVYLTLALAEQTAEQTAELNLTKLYVTKQFKRQNGESLFDQDEVDSLKLFFKTEPAIPDSTDKLLVTEFVRGSPADICQENDFSLQQRLAWVKELCLNLDMMHALSLNPKAASTAHCDIKNENVRLSLSEGAAFIDLGLAYSILGRNKSLEQHPSLYGCNPLYQPPESLDGHFSTSSDVYMLASVINTILGGEKTFTNKERFLTIQQGEREADRDFGKRLNEKHSDLKYVFHRCYSEIVKHKEMDTIKLSRQLNTGVIGQLREERGLDSVALKTDETINAYKARLVKEFKLELNNLNELVRDDSCSPELLNKLLGEELFSDIREKLMANEAIVLDGLDKVTLPRVDANVDLRGVLSTFMHKMVDNDYLKRPSSNEVLRFFTSLELVCTPGQSTEVINANLCQMLIVNHGLWDKKIAGRAVESLPFHTYPNHCQTIIENNKANDKAKIRSTLKHFVESIKPDIQRQDRGKKKVKKHKKRAKKKQCVDSRLTLQSILSLGLVGGTALAMGIMNCFSHEEKSSPDYALTGGGALMLGRSIYNAWSFFSSSTCENKTERAGEHSVHRV